MKKFIVYLRESKKEFAGKTPNGRSVLYTKDDIDDVMQSACEENDCQRPNLTDKDYAKIANMLAMNLDTYPRGDLQKVRFKFNDSQADMFADLAETYSKPIED